jgi:8-oxo-dGTP pyrophosphatase MutT (NUDIX family)
MTFYPINHEVIFSEIEKFNYPNRKIGVIAHIENDKGEILLQQRGIKSRDENGLYEDIGGKVDADDLTFKEAIIREIKEEAGEDINLEFSNSIGIYHCYKNNINWIFIVYFVRYINGNIKIMEPEKCIDYKFFSYDDVLNSDEVTESCKFLTKSIKNNYC